MKIKLSLIIILCSYFAFSQKAELYKPLNETLALNPICMPLADSLNNTFIHSKSFDWTDRQNNCEDRANAVSILLENWGVSNGKAWCFGGKNAKYKNGKGTLKGWSYHVAAFVLVKRNNLIDTLIIDPLTSKKLLSINEWANEISSTKGNLYFITDNKKYQQNSVSLNPTWKLSSANYDNTIKGLTRYNNFSSRQKRKTKKYYEKRIITVAKAFYELFFTRPKYLNQINCN